MTQFYKLTHNYSLVTRPLFVLKKQGPHDKATIVMDSLSTVWANDVGE